MAFLGRASRPSAYIGTKNIFWKNALEMNFTGVLARLVLILLSTKIKISAVDLRDIELKIGEVRYDNIIVITIKVQLFCTLFAKNGLF